MRELHLAKSAGFCYGVRRAVELAESAASSEVPCVLLGHIIHNQAVVEHLASLGLRTVESLEEVPVGCRVVIRSHGESQATYRSPGGGEGAAAGHHRHPGPPGGGRHCRLVPASGSALWGGGSNKLALSGSQSAGNAAYLCFPDHLYTKNLG